ncbi:RebB family R body protein, partial [Klebsiella aerogenes]|uniref:RebB family R body protein n=1 Tax=Klebsiella aerogenes TaxID=548 RepID=UPI001953C478
GGRVAQPLDVGLRHRVGDLGVDGWGECHCRSTRAEWAPADAQQQSYVTSQAATTMGVATLYSLDTAATGVATKDILTPS